MYITQAFGNVDQASDDVEAMRQNLARYDFQFQEREKNEQPDELPPGKKKPNIYVKFNDKKHSNQTLWMLNSDPTLKDINDELFNLGKVVREGKNQKKPKKYLLMCLFAGHGMIYNNSQVLLANELDT